MDPNVIIDNWIRPKVCPEQHPVWHQSWFFSHFQFALGLDASKRSWWHLKTWSEQHLLGDTFYDFMCKRNKPTRAEVCMICMNVCMKYDEMVSLSKTEKNSELNKTCLQQSARNLSIIFFSKVIQCCFVQIRFAKIWTALPAQGRVNQFVDQLLICVLTGT